MKLWHLIVCSTAQVTYQCLLYFVVLHFKLQCQKKIGMHYVMICYNQRMIQCNDAFLLVIPLWGETIMRPSCLVELANFDKLIVSFFGFFFAFWAKQCSEAPLVSFTQASHPGVDSDMKVCGSLFWNLLGICSCKFCGGLTHWGRVTHICVT